MLNPNDWWDFRIHKMTTKAHQKLQSKLYEQCCCIFCIVIVFEKCQRESHPKRTYFKMSVILWPFNKMGSDVYPNMISPSLASSIGLKILQLTVDQFVCHTSFASLTGLMANKYGTTGFMSMLMNIFYTHSCPWSSFNGHERMRPRINYIRNECKCISL